MNKKAFAIALSALSLFTSMPTFGLEKSENTNSKKYIITSIGLGVAIVLPTALILLNKTGNTCNIKGWEDVSNLYFKAAKKAKGETAEYYEHLADGFRCLLNLKTATEDELDLYSSEASKNFNMASNAYAAVAKEFENNRESYYYQINSAKAAETEAKSLECLLKSPSPKECMCWGPETNRPYSACTKGKCAQLWQKLKGKKPSYDAYAEAKRLEQLGNPEATAEAWWKVKNDEELKKSFSDKSWEAYQAFAEANRQEWLFKCNKSNKETVSRAWMEAYKKDKICSTICFIYNAFAAEAYQKAQDALTM